MTTTATCSERTMTKTLEEQELGVQVSETSGAQNVLVNIRCLMAYVGKEEHPVAQAH